jgi:hypothetical protein
MLSIDNAVELMIKTYLGLPSRVTGLKMSRKEYDEAAQGFPSLLTALEKYRSDKLDGIDLAELEWFHRVRNQLYHEGNGLTVEREKVNVYSGLAQLLFQRLFGFNLEVHTNRRDFIADFIAHWSRLERTILTLAGSSTSSSDSSRETSSFRAAFNALRTGGVIGQELGARIDELRHARNALVHDNQRISIEHVDGVREALGELMKVLREHRLAPVP